ncbi:MAG: two-component system, OmpR family, sensor kinase, partial [Acidimicrobiaceae bacterium]
MLLAVGAIALVALVAADFATYSSLRSFLYDRVDQSLDTEHVSIEAGLVGHHDPNERTLISGGTFVQVRDANNQVLGSDAAREPGGKQYTAKLPDSIPLASQHGPGDSPVYLTVPSVEPGGPQFRVRVSTLQGGGQLVVGYSLEDTIVTLDRLRNIELAVTAAALGAAVLLGWWLVKVGLQPLTDVEATANAIAEGDLDRRV